MIADDPLRATGDQSGLMQRPDIPRLRDLLSQPLGVLTGRPMQLLRDLFGNFDAAVAQETRIIEAAQSRIVTAQLTLADQIRPLIQDLIASQRLGTSSTECSEHSRGNKNPEPEHESEMEHNGIYAALKPLTVQFMSSF